MKSNKLNLEDVWKLYLLLEPSLKDRERKELVEDEIVEVIKLSESKALLECIHILYDNKVEINNVDEFVSAIYIGLETNKFFEFVDFIRGFDGSNR